MEVKAKCEICASWVPKSLMPGHHNAIHNKGGTRKPQVVPQAVLPKKEDVNDEDRSNANSGAGGPGGFGGDGEINAEINAEMEADNDPVPNATRFKRPEAQIVDDDKPAEAPVGDVGEHDEHEQKRRAELVRKMFHSAQHHGGSENEKKNALRLAERYMNEWKLALADVFEGEPEKHMGTTSVRLNNVVQNLPSWCHDLYFAAENMTGVRAILEEGAKANSKKRTPTKAYEITFMGVKQDTRDAATIFEVMVNTIYLKGRDEYSGHGRTTIDDYRHGMAMEWLVASETVKQERTKQERTEARQGFQGGASARALIVYRETADAAMDKMESDMGLRDGDNLRTRTIKDKEAYESGREHARDVELTAKRVKR